MPSIGVDKAGWFEIHRACEAAKRTLRGAVEELVEDAAGLPILISKCCDDTHMRIAFQTYRAVPGGKRVKLYGNSGVEFLVANQFFKADIPGAGCAT